MGISWSTLESRRAGTTWVLSQVPYAESRIQYTDMLFMHVFVLSPATRHCSNPQNFISKVFVCVYMVSYSACLSWS